MDIIGAAVKAVEALIGRRSASHAQIADFLDEIAADAEKLAQMWCETLSRLEAGYEDPQISFTDNDLRFISSNQYYGYSKLDAFYRSFTTVIGSRISDVQRDNFVTRLGALLYCRGLARTEAMEALRNASHVALLHTRGKLDQTHDLRSAVGAVQREAAELAVLAKSYRASIR